MSTSARFSKEGRRRARAAARETDEIGYCGVELFIEGVGVRRIARELGTPVYAYSSASILRRLSALRSAFAARPALVCYALKANSNRSVCGLLARAGAGADVVSGGELRRALAAGFAPGSIVFSGVGKTEEELALALRAGVLTLNVESEEELGLLAKVAGRLGRPAPVSIRLNPDVDARTHPHVSTGRAADKFGVERALALELYRRAGRDRRLKVRGIQSHIGSQVASVGPYRKALAAMLEVVSALAARGQALELIDVGGGMGVSYGGEAALDAGRLAAEVVKALGPWPRLRLLVEPGRFLTAESGVLLTSVLYRKRSSRARFVVVDAAMNDLLRPALYGARHPVVPAARRGGPRTAVDVVGPVCESADFLAKGARLVWPKPGDLLAVLKAGAYGFSMASQYNSRPRPPEVLVEGRTFRVIRRREVLADIVRGER